MQERMSEKLWRLEVSDQINAYVKGLNRDLRDSMNIKHSRKDAKLFSITKRSFLEEDVFKYFYPFCLINVPLGTAITLRKQSWPAILLSFVIAAEYIYFLFNFPVEAWHFHRRALSVDKPYAQFLRDSYISRFPDSPKSAVYRRINDTQIQKFTRLRNDLGIQIN